MKKCLAALCMITCIFGLTACGNQAELSANTQNKVESAKMIATEFVIPYFSNFFDDAVAEEYMGEYNKEEMQYIVENVFTNVLAMYAQYGYETGITEINVDGAGMLSGISSFNSAHEALGEVTEIGEAVAVVSDDEIIVTVPVTGTGKSAEAEIIFSNDLFLKVQACALNLEAGMGELIEKAALNTLMGMGTVFVVLILICFIISMLGFIPRMQAKNKGKKSSKEDMKSESVNNTIAQIVKKEEAAEELQLAEADDLELASVIAAAIAASEGAVSADGFVVRSIIRRARR